MTELTDRQSQLLRFITEFINAHDYAPSYREMAGELHIQINAITVHLLALEKKGFIRRGGKRARAIQVVDRGDDGDNEFDKLSDEISALKIERDGYKSRIAAIDRLRGDIPEPYRTLIINVIANGKARA